MEPFDHNTRLNVIIDQINALQYDAENLDLCGATDLEMALDFINDSDSLFDEYKPIDQHLDLIRAIAKKNLAAVKEIDRKRSNLISEYYSISDAYPYYVESTNRYQRSWHEHF